MISFEDFLKVDIRVGNIKKAEEVEESEKLMRLIVDFGHDIGERKIFAGIKKWYKPEDLEGNNFCFVVNLEPKKIMDEESEGMILGAEADGSYVLITPKDDVSPGSKVH